MEAEEAVSTADKQIVILVCGGRTFGIVPKDTLPEDMEVALHKARIERQFLYKELDLFVQKVSGQHNTVGVNVKFIAGGAPGADKHAIDFAIATWLPFFEDQADWKEEGKAAGFIRNQRMLDEHKPDYGVAFEGHTGTADMVSRMEKAGISVHKPVINWSTVYTGL